RSAAAPGRHDRAGRGHLAVRGTPRSEPRIRNRLSHHARPCHAGRRVGREHVGSGASLLVIIRGPGGAGETARAREVRQRHGRGMAVLGQDLIRRNLLWEKKDLPGGRTPEFIAHCAGYLLDAGWPVIVEGILSAARYGPALRALITAHRGRTLVYF